MRTGFYDKQGTAYDELARQPIGSVSIRESGENYEITVYDFRTGSWDVGKSKIERGLDEAEAQSISILKEFFSKN